MNLSAAGPFDFDHPRRRLIFTVPLGVALWFAVLFGFSWLLERTAPPPPELAPVRARIVELPPASLEGGAAAPAKPQAIARPKPISPAHPPPVMHHHRPSQKPVAPMLPPSPNGIAKHAEAPPAASRRPAAAPPNRAAVSGGEGTGSGVGLGGDSSGARAIFAPTPVIPDDLREQAFDTVAVAHFKVAADGTVDVALMKPTQFPALNQILIETLKQWRFFPAMRNGTPVNAEFDLRIPVSVH